MSLRRTTTLLLAGAALALGACGDDDDTDQPAAAETQPAETAPAETTETETATGATSGSGKAVLPISKDLDEKPSIPKPKGEPPAELVVEDIVEGKGEAAKAGDQVSVQYVGVSWSTGEEFDASWDRGEPFAFALGAGQVIPGWDQGVAGMKVGGRRELVIPAELAYGAQGSPPAIGPDETLVFVVDLVSIG